MVNSVGGVGSGGQGQMPPEIRQQLLDAGATEDQIANAGSPEKDQALAEELGITLQMPPPPDQSQGNGQQPPPPNKEEITAQLTQLGVPKDVIEQGPEAVQKFATENGINLPPPPDNNNNENLLFNQ